LGGCYQLLNYQVKRSGLYCRGYRLAVYRRLWLCRFDSPFDWELSGSPSTRDSVREIDQVCVQVDYPKETGARAGCPSPLREPTLEIRIGAADQFQIESVRIFHEDVPRGLVPLVELLIFRKDAAAAGSD